MARARLGLSLALGLLAACGADPEGPDAGPDAGAYDGPVPSGTLEVGTGIIAFEPISDGQTLRLVAGPQSGGRFEGHHVWTALRLTDVAPRDLSTYEVRVLAADGAIRSELSRDIATAPFETDDLGRWVLSGVAPRIDDCCLLENRPFELFAAVTFPSGARLEARAAANADVCNIECP